MMEYILMEIFLLWDSSHIPAPIRLIYLTEELSDFIK